MEELINLLHTGGYSCVIANEGKIRSSRFIRFADPGAGVPERSSDC